MAAVKHMVSLCRPATPLVFNIQFYILMLAFVAFDIVEQVFHLACKLALCSHVVAAVVVLPLSVVSFNRVTFSLFAYYPSIQPPHPTLILTTNYQKTIQAHKHWNTQTQSYS